MRALTPQPTTRAPFGRPGSIDPATLFALPLPMQAEGIRLMLEMGETVFSVSHKLGLPADVVAHIRDHGKLFKLPEMESRG